MCAGGQTERHCGKVGGRSDELAPANDSPGVYTAGQGHGRCYRMRILDQISALVAVADGGEGGGETGRMGGGVGERHEPRFRNLRPTWHGGPGESA